MRQYRYALDRELIEIPAGKLEKGEDPLEAAKRELGEEAGLAAAEYREDVYKRQALNSAWDTDDSSARGRQKVLFPAGKPQLSEFLEVIAKEIKKA